MRKLLTPLLAALALSTAVKAESIWLLVGFAGGGFENIEMIDMNTCKIEAKKLKKTAPFAPKIPMIYCI